MIEYQAKSWVRMLARWRGTILPALLGRIVAAGAVGMGAAVLYREHDLQIPAIGHTLLGAALGLLLVFRTNASYDRFWEGRRLMGMLVNRARDLARQAASYLEGDDAAARADRAELQRLIVVLYALVRQYLRKERDLGAIGARLEGNEAAALEKVAVRPSLAAGWITERLAGAARAGRLTEQRLQAMDANLTSFLDSWGGAERIVKTPVPFAYAHHIKVSLVLFVYTAPFAMVAALRWYTPLAAAALAFGLFGIDEIGVEIEDPFGYDPNDLPLDAIGATIADDTAAIVRDAESRRPGGGSAGESTERQGSTTAAAQTAAQTAAQAAQE